MITAKEDATRFLPAETVKPSYGVLKAVVAFAAQFKKIVQGLKGDGLGIDPWTSHAFELDVCPGNYSGQTETADGGTQHVGIGFGIRIANYKTVVRPMQSDLADVSAEGPSTVMVLTMHVVGNGPAHGNEARARGDWQEPSFREKYVDDIGEANAAFAPQHAS